MITKTLLSTLLAVLSAFLLSAAFISVVTVFGILVIGMDPPIRLAVFTIGQLALSGMAVWLMRKLEVFDIDDFRFKGIVKGIRLAWFGIVYVIISFQGLLGIM